MPANHSSNSVRTLKDSIWPNVLCTAFVTAFFINTSLKCNAQQPLIAGICAPIAACSTPSGSAPIDLMRGGSGGPQEEAVATSTNVQLEESSAASLRKQFPKWVRNENFAWDSQSDKKTLVILKDQMGNEKFSTVEIAKNDGIWVLSANQKEIAPGTYRVVGSSEGKLNQKTVIFE